MPDCMSNEPASLARQIEDLLPAVLELRHELHRYPELGYEETGTAERVLGFLGELSGARVETGLAGTGIKVVFAPDKPGPAVGLRADMDALPIEERSGVPWTSTIPGKMHACGHDGHTAMLAGVGRILARNADRLEGPVCLLFQPAEEGGGGGRKLCEAGVLEDPPVAAMYGLHNNLPDVRGKAGTLAYTEGSAMAGTGTFDIEIHAEGGHAAMPHRTVDPIYCGACLVEQLQGLVARRLNPVQPGVVSVTRFHAGSAYNIIPEKALLQGTFRALEEPMLEWLREAIEARARGVAAAHGAAVSVRCETGYPPLVNDAAAGAVFREIVGDLGMGERLIEVAPNMGGEDFAFYGQRVPAFFYFLPACPEGVEEVPSCHHPAFDFNDDLLPLGMRLHLETAFRFARKWRA
jgi:amidohydrolase